MNRKLTQTVIPTSIGGTVVVEVGEGVEFVHIKPAAPITLSAALNLTVSGTPRENTLINFIYSGTITSTTSTGKIVSIFGTDLTDPQALYEAEITAFYKNSAWEIRINADEQAGNVNIDGANIEAASIATASLADNAITNDKINDMTRGTVKIGGTANAPTDLDAKTDKQILIGDGTDIKSVAMTGDVTISNAGVTTIGAGKVTADMLNFTVSTFLEAKIVLSTAQVLALNSTPVLLIAAPGANKIIQIVRATAFLDYNTATYAGGGNLILNHDAGGGNTIASVDAATITAALDTTEVFSISTPSLTVSINQPVYAENLTAAFTTGDSPVKINIVYTIVDFT